MSEFRRFLRQIFQDVDGNYSSKRAVSIGAFLFLLTCGIANINMGIIVSEFIFDGFMWIVLGGLGITLGENAASVIKAKIQKEK